MKWIYPSTCQEAQNDLLTSVNATNTSVTACTTLDATLSQNWTAWYTNAVAFLSADPGYFGLGGRYDQIQTYASELVLWQSLLGGTCTIAAPTVDPNNLSTDQAFWQKALQWTVVGVAAVAGAYVVGQVISVIPKPERHEELSP